MSATLFWDKCTLFMFSMHFLFLYKKVGLVAILMAKELDIALVKMALEVQQFQFSYFRRIKKCAPYGLHL
jgi:hypothetical protein